MITREGPQFQATCPNVRTLASDHVIKNSQFVQISTLDKALSFLDFVCLFSRSIFELYVYPYVAELQNLRRLVNMEERNILFLIIPSKYLLVRLYQNID